MSNNSTSDTMLIMSWAVSLQTNINNWMNNKETMNILDINKNILCKKMKEYNPTLSDIDIQCLTYALSLYTIYILSTENLNKDTNTDTISFMSHMYKTIESFFTMFLYSQNTVLTNIDDIE
jgi:predicted ABC-type ATPase